MLYNEEGNLATKASPHYKIKTKPKTKPKNILLGFFLLINTPSDGNKEVLQNWKKGRAVNKLVGVG